MARFGFAVKVLGQNGLKSNDSRRWQSGPHLRVSLEYLHAIFDYLEKTGIRMYRMSSDIAPYATHPDLPQFHAQIAESDAEVAALGVQRYRAAAVVPSSTRVEPMATNRPRWSGG